MRATQCQQVVMPDEPDKVLISCGVVVLHCIPRRTETGIRLVAFLAWVAFMSQVLEKMCVRILNTYYCSFLSLNWDPLDDFLNLRRFKQQIQVFRAFVHPLSSFTCCDVYFLIFINEQRRYFFYFQFIY